MSVPYLAPLYYQIDGSPYEQANCTLAMATTEMDRASTGRWRVAAPTLRVMSGDHSGGLTYSQVRDVTVRATAGEVKPVVTYGISPTQLRAMVVAGSGVGVSIDTAVTHGTIYGTAGFVGGHTIGVYEYVASNDTYRVGDPGTRKSYLMWPAWLLYKAALRRGGGVINAIKWPDTEGVSRVCVAWGNVRANPATGSADRGDVHVGTWYSCLSTINGGPWTGPDGHSGSGWVRIKFGSGTAYIAGGLLKAA